MEDNKNSKRDFSWKRWIFIFSIFVAVIIVYKILDNFTNIGNWIRNLFKILRPFVGGVLIAYILYLPCKKIEDAYKTTKKSNFFNRHARGCSIATVYIMAVAIIMILFNCIMPILFQSIGDLVNGIPSYYEKAKETINSLPQDNPVVYGVVNNVIEQINKIDFKTYFGLENITKYIQGFVSAVSNIFNIFIAIVVSIYILSQRKKLVNNLSRFNKAFMSDKAYLKIDRYFRHGNEIFFRFLTSQLLDAIIIGVIVTIAMMILGVKYAILLGFVIGLFNLIPFFGAIIAIIIAIIITLLTGGIVQAAVMAIVVIILQQIDANIINPKIVGNSLNISQLLVIFSVTIGGAYFGVLGMFLAVPIITVIRMMIKDAVIEKEEIESKNQEKV